MGKVLGSVMPSASLGPYELLYPRASAPTGVAVLVHGFSRDHTVLLGDAQRIAEQVAPSGTPAQHTRNGGFDPLPPPSEAGTTVHTAAHFPLLSQGLIAFAADMVTLIWGERCEASFSPTCFLCFEFVSIGQPRDHPRNYCSAIKFSKTKMNREEAFSGGGGVLGPCWRFSGGIFW